MQSILASWGKKEENLGEKRRTSGLKFIERKFLRKSAKHRNVFHARIVQNHAEGMQNVERELIKQRHENARCLKWIYEIAVSRVFREWWQRTDAEMTNISLER